MTKKQMKKKEIKKQEKIRKKKFQFQQLNVQSHMQIAMKTLKTTPQIMVIIIIIIKLFLKMRLNQIIYWKK